MYIISKLLSQGPSYSMKSPLNRAQFNACWCKKKKVDIVNHEADRCLAEVKTIIGHMIWGYL